jgi:D-glycero-D-manno-heptose 1,7-bisphosphate phosphatase
MASHTSSPFAPIPGTRPRPRGLFIDRWGTLLRLPARGHARSAGEVEFVDGALDALFHASLERWNIYLIGNEDAVAHGKVSRKAWGQIDSAILTRLSEHGARVLRSYVCLDDPRGAKAEHTQESVYRLPNTGAFYHAMHNDDLDLGASWVIGDSSLELVAGWRAGLRQVGVRTGLAVEDGAYEVTPEFYANDLTSALAELLSLETAIHP